MVSARGAVTGEVDVVLFRPLVDSAEVAGATGIDGGGIASRSFSLLDSVDADGATVGNTIEPPAEGT